MNRINIGSVVAKLIAAGMLLAAVFVRHPYDYYTILRWVACGVCAYTALQALQNKKIGWLVLFVVATIMLNPFSPLHLKRESWTVVDNAAAVVLLVSILTLDTGTFSIGLPAIRGIIQSCLKLTVLAVVMVIFIFVGICICLKMDKKVIASNSTPNLTTYYTPQTVQSETPEQMATRLEQQRIQQVEQVTQSRLTREADERYAIKAKWGELSTGMTQWEVEFHLGKPEPKNIVDLANSSIWCYRYTDSLSGDDLGGGEVSFNADGLLQGVENP